MKAFDADPAKTVNPQITQISRIQDEREESTMADP